MTLNDLIGTIGVGLILLAYFLNMFSLIKRDGTLYFTINILGAGIACLAAVLIHFMPFILLEAAWVIVSVMIMYFIGITIIHQRMLIFLRYYLMILKKCHEMFG